MNELEKINLPECLSKLSEIFPTELYIVGGKVRNHLMKIDNDDIDLCSSLTLEKLEKLFEGTNFSLEQKNEALGTAKIVCEDRSFDYATLRKEIYEEGGHRQPKSVEFVESIEDDYKRRDFSINAIYYNIKTGQYFDFCDGILDIRRKVVRCVDDPNYVLKDDGLRIIRMVRIASELNFKIDKSTFIAAIKNISNLKNVSGVKLANEISRICSASNAGVRKKDAYLRGINILNKLKAWKQFDLSFERIKPKMVKKINDRSIGLLIDITDAENPASVSYFLSKLLENLQVSKKKREEMVNILSGYYDALNRIPNKVYFAKYFDNFDKIYEILSQKSKMLAQKYSFFYKYIISHKIVVRIADLKVTNKDIATHFPSLPKKSYKIILNMVLSDIFEGKYNNDNETILKEIDRKLKFY